MKLSTRSRYGLRAMMVLAMSGADEPVMARTIAERQNLPVAYLEQLMLTLRKSGLVSATRGAHGGYHLTRPAARITVADVVEALEGPIDIADCAEISNCCSTETRCALRVVFDQANKALRQALASTTLADLASMQRTLDSADTLLYEI